MIKEGSNVQALLVELANQFATYLAFPNDSIDVTLGADPQYFLYVQAAYSLIISHLRKDIGQGAKIESYQYEDTVIDLRYWPVTSLTSVVVVDNRQLDKLTDWEFEEALVADTDYELKYDKTLIVKSFQGGDLSSWRFITASDEGSHNNGINIVVTYDGGWTTDTLPRAVRSGILQQALAMYNRRLAVGTAHVQNPNSSSVRMDAYDVDSGDLLDAVRTMLEPYVYRGRAMDLDT